MKNIRVKEVIVERVTANSYGECLREAAEFAFRHNWKVVLLYPEILGEEKYTIKPDEILETIESQMEKSNP